MTAGPNTQRLREGVEAFNRGDDEALLALLTEDVEWKRVDGLPDEGGEIRAREEVRAFLKPEVFAAARFEPLEIVEAGDTVARSRSIPRSRRRQRDRARCRDLRRLLVRRRARSPGRELAPARGR